MTQEANGRSRAPAAETLFAGNCNCAQAVLGAFADALGIRQEDAFRIAAPFGSGMGRMGMTCGAVTGALMAIGLECGSPDTADAAAKEAAYRKTRMLCDAFASSHGSLLCRELIRFDLSDPVQREAAEAAGVFRTVCARLVFRSAELLEDILFTDGEPS